MSERENKEVIERYIEEIWRNANVDAVDELLADNYVHHTPPPGMPPTREGFKQFASSSLAGLSDHTMETEELLAQGDRVAQRWRAMGTHTGEFMGVPATGKEIEFTGTSVYTVRDGEIVEDWTLFDAVGIMQQLGVIPEQQ